MRGWKTLILLLSVIGVTPATFGDQVSHPMSTVYREPFHTDENKAFSRLWGPFEDWRALSLCGSRRADRRAARLALLHQDVPMPCPCWPLRALNVGAFGNFDITPKTMQKTLAGEEKDYFAVSNLGINIDGILTPWLQGHVSVAYYHVNKGQGNATINTGLLLDEAFFTFSEFAKSPLFATAGLFYLPFGTYDRYAIIPTLTQVLSIEQAAAVQVGVVRLNDVVDAAFYGSQGQVKKLDSFTRIQGALNWGAVIHLQRGDPSGWHAMAGLEWMSNQLNVNALAESEHPEFYTGALPALSAQLRLGYKRWTLLGQWVGALKTSPDLVLQYQQPEQKVGPVFGAKPSAWDGGFVFAFSSFHRPSALDFTYSRSYQSAGLFIFNSTNHGVPQSRYIAGYGVAVTSAFYVRFQWGHDWLYPVTQGDTGRQGDDVTLRLGFRI